MRADWIHVAYGVWLIVGGIMGYQKGSTVSLVLGGGCGALVFFSSLFQSRFRHHIVTGISALLLVVMGHRYVNTGKIVPSGIVVILSLGILSREVFYYWLSGD